MTPSITAPAAGALPPPGEDGYELWLRYRPLPPAARALLRRHAQGIAAPASRSPVLQAACAELQRGLAALSGQEPPRLARGAAAPPGTVRLLLAPAHGRDATGVPFADLGDEGFVVRSEPARQTLIAARTERGLLYGVFAYLRALQLGADPRRLALQSAPALKLRLLNHWDNLDRSVERGYAGASIWDWWKLPGIVDARYTDYARANASLGLNGVVLNNVNARAEILSAPWLAKVAALAGVLRPWGQRVYLSVRFSSPRELGGLATADPLDAQVRQWWCAKADEIYRLIPDFGGFVVKANSEGQPGPQDYGRSHAEGANALAAALAPHGGVLMWRAFVYSATNAADRACQAYDEFVPLDGQFAPNVIVQVKNGAIDYQPREPFHPLFGAMQRTPLMMEFQLTKEYLGFSTHLAYLGTMWQETLASDTHRPQPGTSVAQTLVPPGQTLTGMAGVANVGADRNWCGSHFDQANWYVFGRLAWDPRADARTMATEWATLTFSTAPRAVAAVTQMMMASREAVVDYMTPLGLHHVMATGHHHGPGPWVNDLSRPEWNPTYYHQADAQGIGFDRTAAGSGATEQYAPALARLWAQPRTTPDELLLWFHHLPWTHRMRSGRTLWHELIVCYERGVDAVRGLQSTWRGLRPFIDPRRHADVAMHLAQQLEEAIWWRDASIAYFQSVSGRRLPAGTRPPAFSLAEYQAIRFGFAPGN